MNHMNREAGICVEMGKDIDAVEIPPQTPQYHWQFSREAEKHQIPLT